MHELLKPFPVVIEIPVAWGEMDFFRHVNNIVYFRYFESGRIAYFDKIKYIEYLNETGIGPILASAKCTFKFPLTYPDTVLLGTRVSELLEDRFVTLYRAVSQKHQKIAAEGEGLIVNYDYEGQKKAPLAEALRRRILALERNVSES